MTDLNSHWNRVYREKTDAALSWHQAGATASLALIDSLRAGPETALIDIGGGTARLVDALLGRGWHDLTVLDISLVALDQARNRLGSAGASVCWQPADITRWLPPRRFDLWHDRAVFHFMVTAEDQAAYLAALEAGLAPGGHAVIATFAPDGPSQCSGLPVARYSPETLAATLGSGFALVASQRQSHMTPWGAEQAFQYSLLRKLPQGGA